MPPVTISYATSGGVRQLHCTGCLGDGMAFGLDFGAIPLAEIATGPTPTLCTAAKPTSGLSREKAFYLPGKGWCHVWHPSVSDLTGFPENLLP